MTNRAQCRKHYASQIDAKHHASGFAILKTDIEDKIARLAVQIAVSILYFAPSF